MCLSTVYKNEKAPQNEVLKNVMQIRCEDGCVILRNQQLETLLKTKEEESKQ